MGGIYDLPYPGIFQHPFCMAGFTLLFHPSDHLSDKRKQRILQPLLRQRTAVWTAGRFLWTVPKKDIPKWMKSKWFRYGFLSFFLVMFLQMLWNTYLVFTDARSLKQVVTLLWTFKLPWHWAYHGTRFHPGVAQFAFGFYSVMLTSTVLGLITMALFKPRSWCVYCPMGTMTQLICKALPHRKS